MTRWAELEVGDALPTYVSEPLTMTDFVRYQGASGDMNPVHHDDAYARAAGFPSVFAVGMRQAGVLATYFTDIFGPRQARRIKVEWRAQAWPGDVLSYSSVVESKRVVDGQRFIDLTARVTRQDGQLHLRAWATFALPSEAVSRNA